MGTVFADLDNSGVDGSFSRLHGEVNFRFVNYPGALTKRPLPMPGSRQGGPAIAII